MPLPIALVLALLPVPPQEGGGPPEWLGRSWQMRQEVEAPLVLENARLVDLVEGTVTEGVRIVIRAGWIESLGAQDAPAGAAVLDLKGRFVIPGLFDLHAHVIPLTPLFPCAPPEEALATLLDHGVTTIRLLPFYTESAVDWAARVATGELTGPTIVPASGVYEQVPQRGDLGFGDADTAFQWVQRDALLGARWIKVYNSMSEEALTAIVEAARSFGIRVCGHAEGVPPERAIELGMDCLEHVISLPLSCADEPPGVEGRDLASRTAERWARADDGRLDALLARMRTLEVAWVPTLVVSERIGLTGQHDGRPTAGAAIGAAYDAALRRAAHAVLAQHRAGGLVGLGTDFPVDGVTPGDSVHRELELLVTLGEATPLEALQIGTLGSARVLGLEAVLGTLESGKLAELVVLDENPLEDIRATSAIELVVHLGRVHRPGR
jgi:imidazolonepropionase-like amidohydrolase